MTVQTQDTGKAVSSVIAQSWHRCSKFMQRETWQTPHQAQGLTFDSICRRKTALLTIGQAALEDAWEFMDGRPCALFILDESACILSRCGEPQTLAQLAALGFRDGSYCAESIIGTCALSLAAMQGQPINTAGDRHFKQALQPWSFCSTPVFDNHGRLFGSISLCCLVEHQSSADLSLTLAASEEKIVMIEAGANEVDEETMMKAIRAGHEEIRKMLAFINSIVAEIGKPKKSFTPVELDHALLADVYANHLADVKAAMNTDDKNVRDAAMLPIMDAIAAEHPELTAADLDLISYKLQKKVVRTWLLEDGKRVDGRGINEIRPLAAEVGLLPRVHGSGMFTRGQTQVLTICTLGSTKDAQLMDDLSDTPYKRYIHHYNFPPYSVGEARAPRSPGRREIGHGNLAERALIPVLPDQAEFPYTIRCVSEVLSSNGSTSQASICGSTLALMDAGVPIKAPVAGISCGLITDGDPLHGGRWMTMLDIQGVEDFHGDMDFKVGGTRRGITAIQMDIKVDGLTYDIVEEALEKCRKGRLYILDQIIKPVIAEPRAELSKYAPKMFSMMIPVDKIKDVIGKGGKVIQEMCANFNCKIDIEEDGHVFISAVDQDDAKRAIATIKTIVEDPEIGAIYKGRVTRLMNFGAFVEIAPGKEGLVHISKLDDHRVEHVEDVVAVGDPIFVMVTDIDQQGRINLSRKDAIAAIAKKRAEAAQQ